MSDLLAPHVVTRIGSHRGVTLRKNFTLAMLGSGLIHTLALATIWHFFPNQLLQAAINTHVPQSIRGYVVMAVQSPDPLPDNKLPPVALDQPPDIISEQLPINEQLPVKNTFQPPEFIAKEKPLPKQPLIEPEPKPEVIVKKNQLVKKTKPLPKAAKEEPRKIPENTIAEKAAPDNRIESTKNEIQKTDISSHSPASSAIQSANSEDVARAAVQTPEPLNVSAQPSLGNPRPKYPSLARRRGYEGKAVLSVTVNPHGEVETVELKQSSGYPILDKAAINTIHRWRFRPAQNLGLPVTSVVQVPVIFRLENAKG